MQCVSLLLFETFFAPVNTGNSSNDRIELAWPWWIHTGGTNEGLHVTQTPWETAICQFLTAIIARATTWLPNSRRFNVFFFSYHHAKVCFVFSCTVINTNVPLYLSWTTHFLYDSYAKRNYVKGFTVKYPGAWVPASTVFELVKNAFNLVFLRQEIH